MKNQLKYYDEIIQELRTVKIPFGSDRDRSFIEQMYFSKRDFKLSDNQIAYIYGLLYKYRKQLPDLYNKHKENEFCKPKPKT